MTTLQPLAYRMLVAAYVRQSAEGNARDGETFAWKAWAERAGHDPDAARRALQDLVALGLVRLVRQTDFEGLALATRSVELVEREGLADENLLARQFELRRSILKVLDGERSAHPGHGSMKVRMIVGMVGELPGMVLFGLRVLGAAGLIEEGSGGGTAAATLCISAQGREALARRPAAWPLSAS